MDSTPFFFLSSAGRLVFAFFTMRVRRAGNPKRAGGQTEKGQEETKNETKLRGGARKTDEP